MHKIVALKVSIKKLFFKIRGPRGKINSKYDFYIFLNITSQKKDIQKIIVAGYYKKEYQKTNF